MWKLLLSLWAVPLLLGIVVLMRRIDGVPLIKKDERRLWLGRSKDIRLSLWMGIKFALIAIVLFIVGLVEALLPASLTFIGAQLSLAMALIVIMVVLFFKPEGLFGSKRVERV